MKNIHDQVQNIVECALNDIGFSKQYTNTIVKLTNFIDK